MADYVPLWKRTARSREKREAEVLLLCFSGGPLSKPKRRLDRCGLPHAKAERLLDVRRIVGSAAEEWFAGWRTGSLRQVAERDLGDELAALDAATECHAVRATHVEPADLGYLQTSWAMARWLVSRGASCVLDAHAMRFLSAAAVADVPPAAAFSLQREISFIFETDAASPAGAHYLHTRGMRKLGRPDLVAEIEAEDLGLAGEVLRQLGQSMADGWLPPPRHRVDLGQGLMLRLLPYEPGPQSDLRLNNDALLLVDEAGGPVAGVAARLGHDAGGG